MGGEVFMSGVEAKMGEGEGGAILGQCPAEKMKPELSKGWRREEGEEDAHFWERN
jgi:hypothetical protein